MTSFNPLTATVGDLQKLLESGSTTSVEVVETYLAQISKYNHAGPKLNALISVAPRHVALQQALLLDAERAAGRVRGPLHGIPFVIKENILSHSDLGMSNTAGSWAFVGAVSAKNADLVEKMLGAGMILIGKGNLTEFCGLRTPMMMCGWSSYGGQTISPYVGAIEEGDGIMGHSSPGGSSTGPVVAVAAGFAPLSFGTETIGSIVTPSSRAVVYALKPTVGDVDMDGVMRISSFFDSAGPIARSPRDLLPVLDVLLRRERAFEYRSGWDGLRIGFADPDVWKLWDSFCPPRPGASEQMKKDYLDVIEKIRSLGATVKYPIKLEEAKRFSETAGGKEATGPIAFYEFGHDEFPKHIDSLAESPVQSLDDLIEFNEAHKELTMPPPHDNQNDLIKARDEKHDPKEIAGHRSEIRQFAVESIDSVLQSEQVDIIVAPADSALAILSSTSGYPIGVTPLGILKYNGRPFGLCCIAQAHREDIILHFMTAYESAFPQHTIPKLVS